MSKAFIKGFINGFMTKLAQKEKPESTTIEEPAPVDYSRDPRVKQFVEKAINTPIGQIPEFTLSGLHRFKPKDLGADYLRKALLSNLSNRESEALRDKQLSEAFGEERDKIKPFDWAWPLHHLTHPDGTTRRLQDRITLFRKFKLPSGKFPPLGIPDIEPNNERSLKDHKMIYILHRYNYLRDKKNKTPAEVINILLNEAENEGLFNESDLIDFINKYIRTGIIYAKANYNRNPYS